MPLAESVCVDTSAWIEYLRDSRHPVASKTREHLLAARVCLADVVIGELFQGVRNHREQLILEEFVDTLPILTGTSQTWKAAGQLAASLKTHGKTLHLIDCYLATLAKEHGVSFLTCDGHFDILRTFLPQLQVQVWAA